MKKYYGNNFRICLTNGTNNISNRAFFGDKIIKFHVIFFGKFSEFFCNLFKIDPIHPSLGLWPKCTLLPKKTAGCGKSCDLKTEQKNHQKNWHQKQNKKKNVSG